MNKKNSLIKRILALVALAAAVILVFSVVSANTGSDGSGNKGNQAAKTKKQAAKKKKPTKATYEVQVGDTLTGIAQSTGVSVVRIQKLNPKLDPQALQTGQNLKLR